MIFTPQTKRRPFSAGSFLIGYLLAGVLIIPFIDKTPVRASYGKESPIIKMCEPIDAVEACKNEDLQCGEAYEPELFGPARKMRRD